MSVSVQLSIRLFADKTPLRAGEYAFPAGISLRDAIGKLQSGEVVVRRVTFAEGLSTREILATLSRADGTQGPGSRGCRSSVKASFCLRLIITAWVTAGRISLRE